MIAIYYHRAPQFGGCGIFAHAWNTALNVLTSGGPQRCPENPHKSDVGGFIVAVSCCDMYKTIIIPLGAVWCAIIIYLCSIVAK